MGKTTDTFGRIKFQLPQILPFYTKTYAASKESKIRVIDASFRLHSEFYAEKYSKVFLWNLWNVLMRMCRTKKNYNAFCASLRRDYQIATSAKLLDVMYKSYGLSGDQIQTIN